ncbi:MAG: hypothetical protein GVY19_12720 [Bacteroidetes bacterium]|nr:hypothetical protein [Bacteroidota bacterium]
MKNLQFLILPIFIFIFHSTVNAQEYEMVNNNNGITVYKKKSDHTRKFKTVFEVESSANRVKQLLLTPAAYKNWIDQIIDIKTVEQVNDTLKYVWVRIGVSNILNRQGVIKTTINGMENVTGFVIDQDLDKNHHYSEGDYKQIRGFDTRWYLKDKGYNDVQIELVVNSAKEDRSGFVNNMLDKVMINQLHGLALEIREYFVNR